MPTAELHFFDADDPNGSTIFECSTDDEFVKQIKLDIQRDSLGNGLVNFARKVPIGLFSRDIVVPETLVRVLIPAVHATKYFAGFFINPRQQQVVSLDEKGGEGFTFAGPGPKHYLTRTLLWSASFSGIEAAVEKDNHIWTWPETAVAGRILERLFQEDAANPSGPYLPDITLSFDENDDSDGDPWTENISDGNDDFTLRIGQDYLKLLWQIEDASGITSQIYLGEVGDPQLRLDAFQTFGRDLTEDVAFIEGHNIRDDLEVEGSSYRKASHALVQGNDGRYELAIKPSWDPGELKKVMFVQYESDSAGILDNAGVRALQRQDNGEKQIDLRIVTGFAPTQGRYFPGPDYAGSNGDFWVGDTVSLTTGQAAPTELDYQDEPQVVTGIEVELGEAVRDDNDERRARSFDVTVHLNEERKSSNTPRDLAGNRGTVQPPPAILKLCRANAEGGEVVTGRLYYTNQDDVTSGLDSADYSASWGAQADIVSGPNRLRVTPQNTQTYPGGIADYDDAGVPADTIVSGMFTTLLSESADVLEAVKAGGIVRTVIRSSNRHGVGVNGAAQQNFPEWAVRVYRPGTGFIGTILDVGDGTAIYRFDPSSALPSIPMEGVATAVPSAVGTDYLVVDLGADHQAPITGATGWSYSIADSYADDLPYVVDSVANQNSWLEFNSSEAGGIVGDGNVNLVGTSARAKRCDDTEHWHDSRAPTVLDDFDQGMRVGTLWLDDTTGRVWWLTDNTAGAAVWILISDPTPPDTIGTLIIEEEDGTPTGTFNTLKVPNGSLTDNGDGSASLITVSTGFHYEVLMSGASPAEPLEDGSGTDWLYTLVAD